MGDYAIELNRLTKTFNVFHEPPLTLQKALYNLVRGRKNCQQVCALSDISFRIARAESIGLIGANGCGKTTLLRIIAGIYAPTSGAMRVRGKVAPLLELGAGFYLEFTGIENLYLYAAVFGLSRKQTEQKIDSIGEFAELTHFLDVPLRQYSLGMRMRLAFSLAAHIEPDILLIDEMLAVGDLSFKEKCIKKLRELQRAGRTMLLVSHQMEEIEKLCDRVILLDKGEIKLTGKPPEVIRAYKAMMQAEKCV
jgi:ABC-type polysaccharide/polyol phosphate transport system ATPase subunit